MTARITLVGLAGGGLLATALLQAAAAVADSADPSATGADAFTIGDYTFDPYAGSGASAVEGFAGVDPLSSAPPLLTLGGGTVLGSLDLAPQNFDVYDRYLKCECLYDSAFQASPRGVWVLASPLPAPRGRGLIEAPPAPDDPASAPWPVPTEGPVGPGTDGAVPLTGAQLA